MQSEYEKLIAKYKLSKIFPKDIIITKNAKLKLNEYRADPGTPDGQRWEASDRVRCRT